MRFLKTVLGCLAFGSALQSLAVLPTLGWSQRLTASTLDETTRLTATDSQGNSYCVFTTLDATTTTRMYIRKLSPNGFTLWTHGFIHTFLMSANGMATDSNGNVFLQVTRLPKGVGKTEVDLYGLNSTGTVYLNKAYLSDGSATGLGVTVDAYNDIYEAINAPGVTAPYTNYFLATCYSPKGAILATKSDYDISPSSAAFDPAGNIYVTGQARLTTDPSHSAAFAKYSTTGMRRTFFKSQNGTLLNKVQTTYVYHVVPDVTHTGLFFLAKTQITQPQVGNATYATTVEFDHADGSLVWNSVSEPTNPYYLLANGPNNFQMFGFNSGGLAGTTYYALRQGALLFSQPNGSYLAVAPESNSQTFVAVASGSHAELRELDTHGNLIGGSIVLPNGGGGGPPRRVDIRNGRPGHIAMVADTQPTATAPYGPVMSSVTTGVVFDSIQVVMGPTGNVPSGSAFTFIVGASGIPDQPITIALSPQYATLSSSTVTLPVGVQNMQFTAHAARTRQDETIVLTGSANGVVRKDVGVVKHPFLSSILVPITSSQVGVFVSSDITGLAPDGGSNITITSSDPKTIPSTNVKIDAGNAFASKTLSVVQFTGKDRTINLSFKDEYGNEMSKTVTLNGTQ